MQGAAGLSYPRHTVGARLRHVALICLDDVSALYAEKAGKCRSSANSSFNAY